MKLLDKVQEIFNQYELKLIELPPDFKNVYMFLRKYPEFGKDFKSTIEDSDLLKKYKNQIPRGWYGFDVGTPIVPQWMEIIDNIVEACVAVDPDFEIHQIKIKFGGIRFYCGSNVIEDLHEIERLIGNNLFDPALIY